MKPASFLLPGLVLASGIAWLSTQAISISKLKAENSELAQQIQRASRSGSVSSSDPSNPDRESTASGKKKPALDWKRIAADLLAIEQQDSGDPRPKIRLQQQILKLSAEEIAEALDQIAALDLTDESRGGLEELLFGPLVQKDPRLALERFFDRADPDKREKKSWQLSNALKAWADKDPAAATEWLDKRIADGVFDSTTLNGQSKLRMQFEGSFLASLLSTDSAAMEKRLAAFPPDQRQQLLSEFNQVKERDQTAFAAIVRGQLPEDQQARVLARPAAHLAVNGYALAGAYLDRINATPKERAAAVEEATQRRIVILSQIGKVTISELDEMRTWSDAQSPGSANLSTGRALAAYSRAGSFDQKASFNEALKLANHYLEQTGNDDVLVGFLEDRPAAENLEISRTLAEKIQDPKRREKALSTLK